MSAKNTAARDPYLVKSVVHSSQLLSAFRTSGEALPLREISARSGFHQLTSSRSPSSSSTSALNPRSCAAADVSAQANPDADTSGLLSRYAKTPTGDFDGNPMKITEMDALVAYLQMLGTLVDFSTYDVKANYR